MTKAKSGRFVGIDIGDTQVKMVEVHNGRVSQLAKEDLPDGYMSNRRVVSTAAMSDFLRDMARSHGINEPRCGLVLPENLVYTRRMNLPAMTVDQLRINLPYEFRDFIQSDKERYFYDYALLDMEYNDEGKPVNMDLLACAVEKELIRAYEDMLVRADFNPTLIIPEVYAFANVVTHYESYLEDLGRLDGQSREYCLLDIGSETSRMHIYTGSQYQTTNEIEVGCDNIVNVVAAEKDIDRHTAGQVLFSSLRELSALEALGPVYENIAIQIMRALNFYRFNNQNSELQDLYLCGRGALIEPLKTAIESAVNLNVQPVTNLFVPGPVEEEAVLYAPAYGVALQG